MHLSQVASRVNTADTYMADIKVSLRGGTKTYCGQDCKISSQTSKNGKHILRSNKSMVFDI